MKSFKQFLVEQSLSQKDAEKILELVGGSYDAEEVKSAYKRLAMQHHPDRGGDVKMMQKVNAAYAVLSGKSSAGSKSAFDREARKTQLKTAAIIAAVALKEKFKPEEFLKYFENSFKEKFQYNTKETHVGNSVGINAEFFNADRTTVLDISISTSYLDIVNNTSLSAGDLGLNMFIQTAILKDRRKVKLTNKNYRFDNNWKILSNPMELFPADKIVEKSKKEQSRKMSKRDVLSIFTRELDAKQSGEWVYIPLFDEYKLAIWRSVLMRQGAWSILDIYDGHRKMEVLKTTYLSMIETETSINWFVDEIKKIKKIKDINQIANEIKKMVEYYKQNRERMYAD